RHPGGTRRRGAGSRQRGHARAPRPAPRRPPRRPRRPGGDGRRRTGCGPPPRSRRAGGMGPRAGAPPPGADGRGHHTMTNLAPYVLGPDDTVAAAAVRLRESGIGFGVVVDDDKRVLGTVADGAIRRAALAGDDFDGP